MRSLTCLSSLSTPLPIPSSSSSSSKRATATCFDPESGLVYTAVESVSPNGELELEVFQVQGVEERDVKMIGSYSSSTLPSFTEGDKNVLSLKLLSESRSLCVILAGGDIVTLALEGGEGEKEMEVVGVVDAGIKAVKWSPDDELLVLITGDDKLLQMTQDFEVLNDTPLRSVEFGEDQAINVGWGSKSTQFHGSLGKQAAAAASLPSTTLITSSPSDDLAPRISWREDGLHFCVSTLDPISNLPFTPTPSQPLPSSKRVLRTYSRLAVLQSTSEPVSGLEHPLAWSGSKGLIASTQRFGEGEGRKGRHDLVFFERNGLRHGEFGLREEEGGRYKVKEVSWNADSTALAVWIERGEGGKDGDVVQLWTVNNYHWYLKQEISSLSVEALNFTSVEWHPEQPFKIAALTARSLEIRSFCWDTYATVAPAPNDTGLVAVVDGASLLLTPFRTQNVPPPMSTSKVLNPTSLLPSLRSTLPPIHVAFAATEDTVASLYPTGELVLRSIKTKLQKGTPGRAIVCEGGERTMRLPRGVKGRQLAIRTGGGEGERVVVVVLGWAVEEGRDGIWVGEVGGEVKEGEWKEVEGGLGGSGAGKVVGLEEEIVYQSRKGGLFLVKSSASSFLLEPLPLSTPLPTFCPTLKPTTHSSTPLLFALSPLGKLFAISIPSTEPPYLVASDATSFGISSDFLIYTTSTHESKYAPLDVLVKILDGGWIVSEQAKEWEKRKVERGSVVVTVVSSGMGLVLQMPRGNLESVWPRPLVLAGVRRDVESLRYRDAFIACRKHRIDLNILYDHDPAGFMKNLSTFVEQIEDVDYINLFLGGLKNEDVSRSMYRLPGTVASTSSAVVQGKINKICDAVRGELEKTEKDMIKYVDSILTAHVVKTPPDHEEALRMLHRLKGQHPKVVEDAIKYVIFLTDVNQLFDVALGMYDFQLVLMIAQYSQKDPREYLPFLKELRALDKYYQRFKIDDHLERYKSGLNNLHLAGPERFEESVAYVEKHDLHREAISIWANEPEPLAVMYEVYGDHLYDKRDFNDAALAFSMAGKPARALKAYEKAHAWKELFTLAMTQKIEPDAMSDLIEKIAGHLSSRGRNVEAGRLVLDYGGDVEEAVVQFCKGRDFSEAYRVAALHEKYDLVESVIHPSLLETQNVIMEDIVEIEEQMSKQTARLEELKVLKVEQPESFFMQDDPALENIDVMTDATQATAFTRYTQAASTVLTRMTGHTQKSSSTSKNKRKNDRKRLGGRKGTVDEEEYLLGSFARLVEKFKLMITDSNSLLNHLLLASAEHREAGNELQKAFIDMEEKIASAVEVAWAPVEGEVVVKKDEFAIVKLPRPEKPKVGEWKGGNGFLGL